MCDEDTSRVNYAAPRDSVEQGAHIASEEDTAKPVVSVAIFPAHTNFTTKIRTGPSLIETDDDNTINLDLNADTTFPDRVYLKRWKDPDKADARHNEVKEELESAKCYSIEFSGRLCSDTAEGRCSTEKCNDLLEPKQTTEPVTSGLGVPVLWHCYRHRSRRSRALRREASSVERQLSSRKAFGFRQRPCLGQAPICQDSLVGLGAPERTSLSRRGSALLRHRDRGAALRLRRRRQPCQG